MIRTVAIFRGEPPATFTTAATVDTGHTLVAKTLVLSNNSASAKTFGLKVVPAGEDASTWPPLIKALSLNAGEIRVLELQLSCDEGDRIQWVGSGGSGSELYAYMSGIDNDVA